MARYRILTGLGLAILAGVIAPPAAAALHDQGYICYTCHSLNPAQIRAGSNSIRLDQPILGSIPTSGADTPVPLPATGGYPISCDFCHRAASDIPTTNFATKAYKHPVDLIQTGDANPVNEITCNDCHNGNNGGAAFPDLTSSTLLAKTATDGYPDHDNAVSGYTHTLSLNPPHLTQPYWSALSLPGVNRTNDTTFWTSVRNNTLTPTTDSMICWVCHSTSSSPFTGVTSTRNVKADYTGTGTAKGHQIRTNAGGVQLGVGSALPCYDCHDSHGSVNRGFVLDNQSIYGSGTAAVSVTTFNQGARPYNDKIVCAQCHDTGNTATASTKAIPAQAGKVVEGLFPVDPFNSTSTASLHVTAGIADNMANSTKNCLGVNGGCHASPHNPVGESTGGQNCSICHASTYQAMDNGSSTGYHHVMMSDAAPSGANYPTTQQPLGTASDRTCTICHVDHNYFSKLVNANNLRAKNLRADITLQPDNVLAQQLPRQADFDNSQTRGGICTSCHANTQTKNSPGTNIKADGTTTTPVVSLSLFNPGAHNYGSSSPYIQGHFTSDNADANSYFRANCTKCHNDTQGTSFQDGSFRFALHSSDNTNAVNKLLAPLGIASLTDNLSETFCYRCHSHSTDAIGGTRKTLDGRDWYNNVNMDNSAESTYGLFQRTSRHPVSAADQTAGAKGVECLNCHNVHATRSVTGAVAANPDNTYAYEAYNLTDNSQASKGSRSNFCLKCHDGGVQAPAGLPSYTVTSSTYVPATVYASAATNNKYTYGSRGHWSVSGQLQATTIVACDACHDKHGSTFPKLLGTFDNATGQNRVFGSQQTVTLPNTASPTAQDNASVCRACHNNTGLNYPSTTVSLANITQQETYRDGTGYFSPTPSGSVTTVRWPGFAVWDNLTMSPHRNTTKVGPAALGSRRVDDCNGCHDAHGTAYTYNMLSDNMTSLTFKLCFDCHGAAGPATDSIAPYYPAAAGGTGAAASATVHTGHNIKTSGGKLAQFAALPCYDCHATHGSRNLNTQLKSDQRWSNLGNTKYGATPSDNAADNASRVFCLGCHVTTDNRDGYGNTVAASDNVENLSRTGANRLRLPATNAIVEHTSAWVGNGCQRCHYGRNYNDNTYGPHFPATGLCDTCHESQGARGTAASYTGAHQTHTDNTQYGFACKQCHSWTATLSKATHKNDNGATQHAQVVFDNQATSAWDNTLRYALPFAYEYRSIYDNPFTGLPTAPVPGYAPAADNAIVDARQSSVRWTDGTCSNVWCHSNANPLTVAQGALGASNQYLSAAWRDNSLAANCTGCHGGDATSGRRIGDNTAPTNGSIVHLKHVNGGAGCAKCHYNTVKTANSRQIDNLAAHVNAGKDVAFAPTVGGTWNNTVKSCSGTSCHGTPAPLPEWDNLATVTGCGVCHQSQGPGNTFTFTAPHQTHTDNATYRTACEVCHSNFASGAGPNAVHADGDNAVGAPRTVQVAFTDCAANQTYNSRLYYSSNMKLNPHTGLTVAPAYTENAAFVGGDNDSVNPAISWSRGTCNTVWCHSNANPLPGGNNAYRTPQWTGTLGCTPCHGGAGNITSMTASLTDNLSRVHVQHAATNLYGFTCDACHAWTVANDCTTGINGATGFDNHINGLKTVRFDNTFKGTINMSGGTYDNAVGNYRCYNTYCHSNGTDNAVFNTAAQWPVDNTVGWDNIPTATCRTCHAGDRTASPTISTNAHDNHVFAPGTGARAGTQCNRCHNATVAADNVTISSYALHVNGYRNVSFPTPADNGSYVNASRTCNNTNCHRQGNRSLTSAQDNLSITWDNAVEALCKRCHGSKPVSAGYAVASNIGEPNYDNGAFGGGDLTRNSHSRHVSGTDNTTVCQKCHPSANPSTVNTLATDNWARHINDNVDVAQGTGVTFQWTPGTHTCGNISCHNGGTAVWGAALNCYDCHVGTGDLDDFGTGTFASMNNGLAARVDSTEWTTRGHGRTTAYLVTLHPAANFTGTGQCVYCHNSAVAHDNASNPFRLANFDNPAGSGWNGVCMVCHRKTPAPLGYDPDGVGTIPLRNSTTTGTQVDTAHYGAKHSSPDNNGGKFCYDCHDPHGDNNIFMVGSRVVRATDNTYGIPRLGNDNTYKMAVAFADNSSFANYADNGAPYNKICNVCHYGANHYRYNFGDTHNRSGKCTTCHSHDDNFKGAGTCVVCHAAVQGSSPARRQVTGASGDFLQATHHVTNYIDNTADGAVQNVDCSKCHWEGWLATDLGFPANSAGKTNPAYHYVDLSNNATAKYVQLRVWAANNAPTNYTNSSPGLWRNDAAFNVTANAINMNNHCLGCHSIPPANAATPFSDGLKPTIRSWDNNDIAATYLRAGTTPFNKYAPGTDNNTVPVIAKAFSAHFRTGINLRGVAINAAWVNDQGAVSDNTATGSVACFDCHNSHGSNIAGNVSFPLTSYSNNATYGMAGNFNGGLFKQTTLGVSGFSVTYSPATVNNATAAWGAGASLCFNCHTGGAGGITPPKTYADYSHSGARNMIAGYYDPVDWRNAVTNDMGEWTRQRWSGEWAFKNGLINGTHFLPSTTNANGTAITRQTTTTNLLLGRCTLCHDPHGVTVNTTKITAANQNYAVPMLKGTWLHSPYLEDRPGDKESCDENTTTTFTSCNKSTINGNANTQWGPRLHAQREYNRPRLAGAGYGLISGPGHDGFYIDENTFGATFGGNANYNFFNNNANNGSLNWRTVWSNGATANTVVIRHITETNAQFAGLCEQCHSPAALYATNSKQQGINAGAHRTVKGYGGITHDIVLARYFNNATNSGQYTQQIIGGWPYSNQGDERFLLAGPGSGRMWSGIPMSWGLNLSTSGQKTAGYIQSTYHEFPCSKCHTPHASRLPRLLKTNCLDLGYNNDAGTGNFRNQKHTNNANANIMRMITPTGNLGNWTGAVPVRCHNNPYLISATAANDTRWNTVTPW